MEALLVDIIEGDKPSHLLDRKQLIEIINLLYGKYMKSKISLEMELEKVIHINEKLDNEHIQSLSLLFQIESQNMKNEQLNQELRKINRKLDRINKHDYLTKVLNRRTWMEMAELELSRTKRSFESITKAGLTQNLNNLGTFIVAILDIDNFKKINDRYGHLIGDKVLRELGRVLKARDLFRKTDLTARYGGEEFVVLFPDLSLSNAGPAIQKILERIRQIRIQDHNGGHFSITCSIGVSEFRYSDNAVSDILKRSDDMLYEAKKSGKNCAAGL